MSLKDKLFGFEGRLRRQDWWVWGFAVGMAWNIVEFAVSRLAFSGAVDFDAVVFGDSDAVVATALALTALSLWPTAALCAKRAHDLNWPAWPVTASLILAVVLPYLPFDLTPAFSNASPSGLDMAITAVVVILVIAWIVTLIVLGFIDGTPGPNRFGPSPKASELPDAA